AGPRAIQAAVVPLAAGSGRPADVLAAEDRGGVAPLLSGGPTSVPLRVESDPAGATVKEDGVERCSSTPCSIAYDGPPREHTLTIARQGYRAEVRTATPGAPLHVRLMVAPSTPRAVLPPTPAKEETPTAPNGYKTDIPY
ncbi:MAG: PEGA domain-containing protein, partial [Myxococcota bacterium]|nr:PEGA domain-containing protein [Myxococcota bacterium]